MYGEKNKISAISAKNSYKRKTYIDFLRLIAIYMVLFNHTGMRGFILYTVAKNSVLYPLYFFNTIFIKIAVPLFFLITGALLLDREESIKKIIQNRFLKYAIVLLVSSVIAYIYYDLKDLSLTTFIKKCILVIMLELCGIYMLIWHIFLCYLL